MDKPWYAKMENLAVREMFSDKWMQVKAFFSPSDYTREAFSTVTRGWVAWQVFLIGINLLSSVVHLFQSNWLIAFLYFLISALFALVASYELMMNMARKTIDNLFEVARQQQKTMHEMMDVIEGTTPTGEFD